MVDTEETPQARSLGVVEVEEDSWVAAGVKVTPGCPAVGLDAEVVEDKRPRL